jgi:hypothetical protein
MRTPSAWCLSAQDEEKAAGQKKKGLGVGGTKKRVRIVEQETKRLQQVKELQREHRGHLLCHTC